MASNSFIFFVFIQSPFTGIYSLSRAIMVVSPRPLSSVVLDVLLFEEMLSELPLLRFGRAVRGEIALLKGPNASGRAGAAPASCRRRAGRYRPWPPRAATVGLRVEAPSALVATWLPDMAVNASKTSGTYCELHISRDNPAGENEHQDERSSNDMARTVSGESSARTERTSATTPKSAPDRYSSCMSPISS